MQLFFLTNLSLNLTLSFDNPLIRALNEGSNDKDDQSQVLHLGSQVRSRWVVVKKMKNWTKEIQLFPNLFRPQWCHSFGRIWDVKTS